MKPKVETPVDPPVEQAAVAAPPVQEYPAMRFTPEGLQRVVADEAEGEAAKLDGYTLTSPPVKTDDGQ